MNCALLLGCLLSVEPFPAPTQSPTVALRSPVTVATPQVALTQVAHVSGPDEVTTDLAEVSLGSAPPPGMTRTISLGYVKMRLRRYGIDPQTVAFTGGPVVVQRTAAGRSMVKPPATAATKMSATPAPDEPLVHRNETVALQVRCGGVVISLKGRARHDGRLGEAIDVYVSRTNRTVQAQVTAAGQLVLDL